MMLTSAEPSASSDADACFSSSRAAMSGEHQSCAEPPSPCGSRSSERFCRPSRRGNVSSRHRARCGCGRRGTCARRSSCGRRPRRTSRSRTPRRRYGSMTRSCTVSSVRDRYASSHQAALVDRPVERREDVLLAGLGARLGRVAQRVAAERRLDLGAHRVERRAAPSRRPAGRRGRAPSGSPSPPAATGAPAGGTPRRTAPCRRGRRRPPGSRRRRRSSRRRS